MSNEIYKNINICFLYGKIVSDVKFDFSYNGEYISIATCLISNNNNIFFIRAFDEIADELYQKYEKNDYIRVCGKLRSESIDIEEFM